MLESRSDNGPDHGLRDARLIRLHTKFSARPLAPAGSQHRLAYLSLANLFRIRCGKRLIQDAALYSTL